MFEDEVVSHSSNEVSQKTSSVAGGSDDQLDRDLTGHEWALQYIDLKKKLVLLVTRIEGRGCHDMARLEPMTLGYMSRALDHNYIIYCNT